jgi:hypothetical protein
LVDFLPYDGDTMSPTLVVSVVSSYGGNDPNILAALEMAAKANERAREVDEFI